MDWHILASVVSSAMVVGCTSQQESVNIMQPEAVQTARQQGSSELNCPGVTAQVLTKNMIQNRSVATPAAPERAEYPVGVKGCGKVRTYIVICTQGGTGCVIAGSRQSAVTPAPQR
jgi:hypothetical protein